MWRFRIVAIGAACLLAVACVNRPMQLKSNALDYLYPRGKTAEAAGDVTLHVPVRVGVAFAPAATTYLADPFSEAQKRVLLERLAGAFGKRDYVASVEVIPTSYLAPGGGFEELDRLATSFGIDLVALVSYDQRQFNETTNASWTYLTVVGAFAIPGEKNETRTVMDTVVYDIASRALLFRAAGESAGKGRSTPIKAERELRQASEVGFDEATTDMIAQLDTALAAFKDQAKQGTVRGVGTPGVEIVNAQGGGHAGALGALELGIVLLIALGAVTLRR